MQDHLTEIKKKGHKQEPQNDQTNSDLLKNFDDFNRLKTELDSIQKNIGLLKDGYNKSLFLPNISQVNQENIKLEEEIQSSFTNSINWLKKFSLENQDLISNNTKDFKARIYFQMTNKLYQIINQYKETQSNYREKYKEKLRLRAKIIRPNLSDQEVDHLVESGTIEYAQEIVGGHRHKLAVDSLGYIEQRHKDIVSIESGIKDLHQLFVDMSFLVQEQELMLDNIETNVQNSNLMVENAKKNLTNANKGAKKSRKKLCIVILILVIIIVVVGILFSRI